MILLDPVTMHFNEFLTFFHFFKLTRIISSIFHCLQQGFLTRSARNVPKVCGVDKHCSFTEQLKNFFALYKILRGKLGIYGRDDLFFWSSSLLLNSAWGCENWLVIEKGCQQVKRFRTTGLEGICDIIIQTFTISLQFFI